jgi:hypothetical protein
MYLVYLNYIFIIGIIYAIYLIKKNDQPVKKKYILIVLVIILIVNSIIIIGFINKKNQLTDSTYKIYLLLYDSMSKTVYSNKVETVEDVKKLLEVTRNINKNLTILEYNLRFSEIKLYNENDQKFYIIIKSLNSYLSEFILQHDKLYSKKIYIDEDIQKKYSKLKTELNILYDYFGKIEFISRNKIGIKKYYIVSKEKNFNWDIEVQRRLKNIQKLIIEGN